MGVVALLAGAAMACTSVTGSDRVFAPSTKWVLVGELHGTNEIPDAFANLVCLAGRSGRTVVVALELSADWQPAIDAWIQSDGGPSARAALLALPIWSSPDGRGSTAFVRLLDTLRRQRQAGVIQRVVAADVGRATPDDITRDAAMAAAWTAAAIAPDMLVVALVGGIHAMRRPYAIGDRTIVTAGSLMPSAKTVTLNVVGSGGTAWNCQDDGCGTHEVGGLPAKVAGITPDGTDSHFDATYALARPTSAAKPAAGSPRVTPPVPAPPAAARTR